MKPSLPLLALLLLNTLAPCMLHAQDGLPANDTATAAPDDAFAVNTEAWDTFVSFDGQRIFGNPSQHSYIPAVTYFTSYTKVGKVLANSTVVPSISTSGPMFGGEGYGTFSGVLPFDNDDAYQFNGIGGWKYHLLKYVDIDIGGGIAVLDKNSFGAGQPSQFGTWYRNAFYLGFVGRIPLNPYAYVVYDFSLEQVQGIVGVTKEYELAEDWKLFGEARLGYLSANSYFGDTDTPGIGKWQNGYTYWQVTADLIWTPIDRTSVTLGIGYTGNNDGEVGVLGIGLGPEGRVFAKVGVSYAF